jgi:hypothetical protein
MQPVPYWRKWWKRWSTWLALLIPLLAILREALPELKEVISIEAYKGMSAFLGFAIVVATQIKQKSVSGGDDEDRRQ